MKIFVDYHHASLYRSLQLLFEERLGYELYRPIGIEWFDKGYWKIADPYPTPRDTALQFLDTRGGKYKKETNLNGDYRVDNQGIYHVYEPDHDVWQRAITLDTFKKMQFDILIASYNAHIIPYLKLINLHQTRAKLIHQMGNNWASTLNWKIIKNVMASTAIFGYPPKKNVVFYHQEIDPKLFNYRKEYSPKSIMSFSNVLHGSDLATFIELEKAMPTFHFFSYGAGNRDGSLTVRGVAEKMKAAQFVAHFKEGGDGFGHVIFNAFALGKPPIVKMNQYKGQLAYKLMKDRVTCIDIGNLKTEEAVKKIMKYVEPENYSKMSFAAHSVFEKYINYDKEAKNIEIFLKHLQ